MEMEILSALLATLVLYNYCKILRIQKKPAEIRRMSMNRTETTCASTTTGRVVQESRKFRL